MASLAQKRQKAAAKRKHQGHQYRAEVTSALAELDSSASPDAIDEALRDLDSYATAGKMKGRNMRAAARLVLEIAHPAPSFGIVKSKAGSYAFEVGGGCASPLTPAECTERELTPGPANK